MATISTNGTYNSITLTPGAYVVISNCTIKLKPGGTITVDAKSVLKIINSTITREATSGSTTWSGINIIGNPIYDQITETIDDYEFFHGYNTYNAMQHGSVWVDHSTISYADKAIISAGRTGGGYCFVDHGTFRDNDFSIYFTNYPLHAQNTRIDASTFDNPHRLSGYQSGIYYAAIYLLNASGAGGYTFTVENCEFMNTGIMSSIIGIRVAGSYINIYNSYFTALNVGFLLEKGPYLTGAQLNGGWFERCDRGAVALGADVFYVSNSVFDINKTVKFGTFSKINPAALPVGLFIAGSNNYNVVNSYFDKVIGSLTGSQLSYGIVVDGNSSFGYDLVSKNTFAAIDIGFQTQNENLSTFLQCNNFSYRTFNYDITIPAGTLRRHDGCPLTSVFNGMPKNIFSSNPVHSDRNIKINSNKYTPSNKFLYSYYYSYQNPFYSTSGKISTINCNLVNSCETVPYFLGFTKSASNYIEASSIVDSLRAANADTGTIETAEFFKGSFLGQMVFTIANDYQFDSAINILKNDTSVASVYHKVMLYLSKGSYASAQSILDNLTNTSNEALAFKEFYNVLIPIYSDYSFEALDSIRSQIDSMAIDSGFIGKQARYLVNFIDETNAILDSSKQFTPQYTDSILPVDSIDNIDTTVNNYLVTVYPNPFVDDLYADFTNNSGTTGIFTLKLYDSYAALIDENQISINDTETKTFHLSTSGLGWGFYYLQIVDNNAAVITARIIYKAP